MTAADTDPFERHVDAVRRWEPTVRALVGWDEEAARDRANRSRNGPLAGWALGVKDIIDVEGLPTLCGTDFLPETPASRSASVVERLESLGTCVISKVVTSVLAYFDPGPTTNPWNPAHTPGGSSMGSAAGVAAGMMRLSLGSQTIGSVNRPASFCGVVGFKPSYERMPRDGVFPFSPSVDTVGFFTRNTADMTTACAAFFGEPAPEAPATLRVGLIEDMYCEPADDEMLAALREVGEALRSAGLDVSAARFPEAMKRAYGNHVRLVAAELAIAQRETFEAYGDRYPPKIRDLLLEGRKTSAVELEACLELRSHLRTELDGIFDEFDVIATPSAPGAAPRDLTVTGDPRMNLIPTHTGAPSLTLPAKLSPGGLPLGVQLIGRRMRDMAVLAAGARLEALIGFRNVPQPPP